MWSSRTAALWSRSCDIGRHPLDEQVVDGYPERVGEASRHGNGGHHTATLVLVDAPDAAIDEQRESFGLEACGDPSLTEPLAGEGPGHWRIPLGRKETPRAEEDKPSLSGVSARIEAL